MHGGLNQFVLYRLSADHTKIYTVLTGTTVATVHGTANANAAYTFKKIKQSDYTFDKDGIPTVKLGQKQFGAGFDSLIELACPAIAAASATVDDDYVMEDGSIDKGSADSTQQEFIGIGYLGIDEDGKCVVIAIPGYVDKSSGSTSHAGGKTVEPTFSFVAVAAKASIPIIAGLLDETVVDEDAILTVAENYYYKRAHLEVPEPV